MKMFIEFVHSFGHAWRGLLVAFHSERSFRIQIAVALCVIVLSNMFLLHSWERIVLLLAIGSVLVLELLNSSVERLVDLLKPSLHQYVKDIKDLMAAAVLVASLFALAIGSMILCPYLIQMAGRV
jgi:diacylglycerol kinase